LSNVKFLRDVVYQKLLTPVVVFHRVILRIKGERFMGNKVHCGVTARRKLSPFGVLVILHFFKVIFH